MYSPILLHSRSYPEHLEQTLVSKAPCFTSIVHCVETAVCPRNRPWQCVCGVHCAFSGCCSVWAWAEVVVSPSLGPLVYYVSAGCVQCCDNSTGRRPTPGSKRRGPHLTSHVLESKGGKKHKQV